MKTINKLFMALLTVMLVLTGCQSGDSGDSDSAQAAHARCVQIVANEFTPLAIQQNPPSKTRDLDNDGVSDVIEYKMGLDLCRADSDADGLTDFHEAVIAGKIKPEIPINVDIKCANYGYDCDSDGDGLSNFKETHGFYHSAIDDRFLSLSRLVSKDEWESLKTTSITLKQGEINPWLVAIKAVERSGHNRPVTIDGKDYFAIDLEKVRLSITQAFLNIYGDANHVFLSANSNQAGTVANIMNELLAKPAYNKDLNGKNIATYHTDPTKWSTDLDPYSDSQEISGINNVSGILHPADHPLIAGYPRVRAVLDKILIVPVKKITDSKGNSTENSWETSMKNSQKRTTGWSVGGSLKAGASKDKGPERGFGLTGGYSDSTTKIQSSSTKIGGKNKTDFKSATGVSSVCAAHAWFTIRFENLGTAPITKLKPAFNLFFNQGPLSAAQKAELEKINQGKTDKETQVAGQKFTFAPNVLNRDPLTIDHLAPKSSSKPYTFPYVGESGANRSAVICLTLDQLAFLENEGGVITIDMLAKGGEINFWDQNTKRVVTGGNWEDYRPIINANAAIVDYDLIDINGDRHQGNYMAYAGTTPRLSLAQAMKLMLTKKQSDGTLDKAIPNCSTDLNADSVGKGVCLKPNGDLNLSNSPNTFFAVHAFDQTEKPITPDKIDPVLKQSILNGDVNNIYLNPHWRYQFISHGDIQLPHGSGARVTLSSRAYELTAWASDLYGSNVKAKICKGGLSVEQSTQCSDELTPSSLSYGAMLHYTYTFPTTYNFTGEEHLLLINADGQTKIPLTSSDVSVLGNNAVRPASELGNLQAKIDAVIAAKEKFEHLWANLHSSDQQYAHTFSSEVRKRERVITERNALISRVSAFLTHCSKQAQNGIDTLQKLNKFKSDCSKQKTGDKIKEVDAHTRTYARFDEMINLGERAFHLGNVMKMGESSLNKRSQYYRAGPWNSVRIWEGSNHRDIMLGCDDIDGGTVITGIIVRWNKISRAYKRGVLDAKDYVHSDIDSIVLKTAKVSPHSGDFYDRHTRVCSPSDSISPAKMRNRVNYWEGQADEPKGTLQGSLNSMYDRTIEFNEPNRVITDVKVWLKERRSNNPSGLYYEPEICVSSVLVNQDSSGKIVTSHLDRKGDNCGNAPLSNNHNQFFKGLFLSTGKEDGSHKGRDGELRTHWITKANLQDTRPEFLRKGYN